jgi:hypothetical protein
VEEKEYYPLSLPQKRFYIFQQLHPENVTYNLKSVWLLEGELERDRLEQTFRKLIRRHETLRTAFQYINGKPMQRIYEPGQVDFSIEYHEIGAGAGAADAAGVVNRFTRPFDLHEAPLMRAAIVQLAGTGHLLMVDIHHIIADGISSVILSKEFTALYGGDQLSPLLLQYKDFSGWQDSEKQRAVIKKQGKFWIKQFQDGVPLLNLPTDYPRPAIQGFEGGAVYFEIPAQQTRALKELALREEVSLYMVLLSIYNILLAKLSGVEDIVVGVGTAGRSHADLMNIIGLMFNTIPLRSRPQGGKYYPGFLRDLKTGALEAFENQEYPFDMLVEDLLTAGVLNRDTGRNPLFDTMFALQDFGEDPGRDTGLILKPYEFENRVSRFDLFFIVTGTGDTLRVKVEYAAALFKPAAVERMVQGYKEILAQILTNRQIKLEDIVVSSSRRLVKVELPVDDSADSEHMGFGF